jgi:hypothetical protein
VRLRRDPDAADLDDAVTDYEDQEDGKALREDTNAPHRLRCSATSLGFDGRGGEQPAAARRAALRRLRRPRLPARPPR